MPGGIFGAIGAPGPGGHASAQGGFGGAGSPRGADRATNAQDQGRGSPGGTGVWGENGELLPPLACLGL